MDKEWERNRMRILLVSPRPQQTKIPVPSWIALGLPFIASALRREGHVLSIFDRFSSMAHLGINKDRINRAMMEHIQSFKPELIGLTTVSPLIFDTVECAELIRKAYSGVLVAGGHHATAMPEMTLLKIPDLDGVVEGEGEMVLKKLAAGLDPAAIPGLWWRDEERGISHIPAQAIDPLDDLPFPALDLLDMAFYTRPGRFAIRGHYLSTVSVLTSRGCVKRCDFCTESLTYGRGVRFHSPDYVIEWIKQVLTDYPNAEGVYLHDNDFLIDEERARTICEKILSTGLEKRMKWSIQTRVDRVHPEILKLLKKAGCISIELGIESALQKQLDSVHKGTTGDLNERAIRLCREQGFSTHVSMIAGFEGETISDLVENLRWLKRAKPNTFSWFSLEIHPGTSLYQRKGDRFFELNAWSEENIANFYNGEGLSTIPPKERSRWMKKNFLPYHSIF
jgi:anaerobic magnesium-protoporphyrin IX monomethyl ester cyclase